MDSDSDISLPESGSRLLSESSLNSNTGHGGDDLTLSELSLSEKPLSLPPFSLLGRNAEPETPTRPLDNSLYEPHEGDERSLAHSTGTSKEDKLRGDLGVLRKLNSAFSSFHEALDATSLANKRIATQLAQTDELLNQYVTILSRSEEYSRLILDDAWQGAVADEEMLAEEQAAHRREEEDKELAAQKARERAIQEREMQEKIEQEEKGKSHGERPTRGMIRGVRGTRASMRGQRGSTNPRATSTGIRRPSSATGTRGSSGMASRGRS